MCLTIPGRLLALAPTDELVLFRQALCLSIERWDRSPCPSSLADTPCQMDSPPEPFGHATTLRPGPITSEGWPAD
jgi:hypothetical protein